MECESVSAWRNVPARRAGWARAGGVALLISLALGGCAAPSNDRSLTFAFPLRYSAPPGPGAEPLVDRWWTRFRSAELNRLVEVADGANFDVAAAVARLDQADAQARVAEAALFPTLGFSVDAQQSRSSGTTTAGFIASPKPRSSFDTGLNASYVVDIWGRLRDQKRAAQWTAEASIFDRDAVRLTTQGSVINAYLQLALAQERLRIASENLRSADRILGVIRQRLSAGTGTALDIAQQETLVANQRASIPPLRQTAANSQTALALLLGTPPQGFAARGASLNALGAPRVAPGLPSALLLRRPDIRSAEARLASADANLDAARKALLPSLELTAQGGLQSAALRTLIRPESAFFSLAAGLTQTIFDGGRLASQVDLSDAQRRELLEDYRKAIVSALTDVENALIAIRENDRREAALRVSVRTARTAFNLSEERLRQGTIDLVTLLNTQQTLFSAQDSLAQTRYSRLQASVSLFQALGGDFAGPAPRIADARTSGRPAQPYEGPSPESLPQ